MKKVLFLFMLLLFVGTAESYAQKAYRVTGNNVIVRKGPGTKYGVVKNIGGTVQLWKGYIVKSDKAPKNGFVHFVYEGAGAGEACDGWVSMKFLKPATKCSACNGRGNTGRKCSACNGEGGRVCCNYTGMELCEKCGGEGYK